MDENTRFLIERMDEHYKNLSTEISLVRSKVDTLNDFRNKVIGMAMIISGSVSLLFQWITGNK